METPSLNIKNTKVYLVGGAVRDGLLKQPVHDKDYVVVGATVNQMIEAGFKQVGKDFPVFLHPDTNEEYALARTERKSGSGYNGFEVFTDPSLTVEDDLSRRDLTINAIAKDSEGNFVDPYNGIIDLNKRILRHVSEAFAEDPLRVLRVARFAARYHHLGFTIAPETIQLMRDIVNRGEIDALTKERVFIEIEKTFTDKQSTPSVFLAVLHKVGALEKILPEVDALYGVPQSAAHHPEIDTGIHTEMVLDVAHRLAPERFDVQFAALVHDLGKALTPKDQWPRHIGHEEGGIQPLEDMASRMLLPAELVRRGKATVVHHLKAHQALDLKASTILKMIQAIDGFRRPDGWECFLLACEADKRGRLGLTESDYPQADFLRVAYQYAKEVKAQPFLEKGYQGEELAVRIYDARVSAIKHARKDFDFSRKGSTEVLEANPNSKVGRSNKAKP